MRDPTTFLSVNQNVKKDYVTNLYKVDESIISYGTKSTTDQKYNSMNPYYYQNGGYREPTTRHSMVSILQSSDHKTQIQRDSLSTLGGMDNVRIEVMAPVINNFNNNMIINPMNSRRHTSQTNRRQQFGQELMQNLSSGNAKGPDGLIKKLNSNFRSSSQLRIKRSEPTVSYKMTQQKGQILSKLKNKFHQSNAHPSVSNSDFLNTKITTQMSKQGLSQDVITAISQKAWDQHQKAVVDDEDYNFSESHRFYRNNSLNTSLVAPLEVRSRSGLKMREPIVNVLNSQTKAFNQTAFFENRNNIRQQTPIVSQRPRSDLNLNSTQVPMKMGDYLSEGLTQGQLLMQQRISQSTLANDLKGPNGPSSRSPPITQRPQARSNGPIVRDSIQSLYQNSMISNFQNQEEYSYQQSMADSTYQSNWKKNGLKHENGIVYTQLPFKTPVEACRTEPSEMQNVKRSISRQLPVFKKHKMSPWKYTTNKRKKKPSEHEHSLKDPYASHLANYHQQLKDRQVVIKDAIEGQIKNFHAIDEIGTGQEDNVEKSEAQSKDLSDSKKKNDESHCCGSHYQMVPLKTLGELDLEFREKIQGGCRRCNSVTKPTYVMNILRSDPDVYKYLVQFRAYVGEAIQELKRQKDEARKKKQREKNGGLIRLNTEESVDLIQPHISELFQMTESKPKNMKVTLGDVERLNAEMIEAERQKNYKSWSIRMWAALKEKNKKNLELERGKVIGKYDEFAEQFVEEYLIQYEIVARNDQKEKESMWIDKIKHQKMRENLKLLLERNRISQTEFFENLINVIDEDDLQKEYFENIQDLKMPQPQNMFDIEINDKIDDNNLTQKQVVDMYMDIKSKQTFLQKKMKDIYKAKNIESTGDTQIEFAKQCHQNQGLPLPRLANDNENMKHKELVQIDTTIPIGVAKSVKGIVLNLKPALRQIYFVGNGLSGSEFSSILASVDDGSGKQNDVRSIIYGGKNQFTYETYETLQKYHLSKRPPWALKELKFLDVRIEHASMVHSLITNLDADFRLQSLALSRVDFDSRSAEALAKMIHKKFPELKELDISWSNMTPTQMKRIFEALRSNQHLRSLNLAFNPVKEEDDIKDLGNFVRQNFNLQHLDLSGVLRSEAQVQKIVKKAKKTQSLVSLHLNHTPCIQNNESLVNYIIKKLDAKNQIKSKDYEGPSGQPGVDWRDKQEMVLRTKAQSADILYYQRQKIEPPADLKWLHNFVLQRTIAHPEISSNRKWFIHDECYVCARWKYTLFVAGKQGLVEGKFKTMEELQPYLIDIKMFARTAVEGKGGCEADLDNFIELLPPYRKDQIEDDRKDMFELKTRFENGDIQLYLENDRLWYRALQQKIKCYDFDYSTYCQNLKDGQDPNLWVYPCYLKPSQGVTKFNLKKDRGDAVYFVPEIRKEGIPIFSLKADEEGEKEPPFVLENSIFKKFQADNAGTLYQAFKADIGYWKAAKFVKDKEDQQRCQKIIEKYFERLKNIFVTLISGGDYPHIGRNDLGQFCRDVQILDGTIPQSTVDRMFIATKVGATKIGPGNMLFRHEFLEVMIRIANAKYREELGSASSYSEALEMMLEDICEKFVKHPWQEFRDELLWSNKIDNLYKANNESLVNIHEELFPKYSSDGVKRCIDLVCKYSKVQLSEKETRFAFGMSKMTVRDEVGNHQEYDKLRFPEFLEFIGRIAHTKYFEDQETPFLEKVETILDEILPVYGLKRNRPDVKELEDETSDESLQIYQESIYHSIEENRMPDPVYPQRMTDMLENASNKKSRKGKLNKFKNFTQTHESSSKLMTRNNSNQRIQAVTDSDSEQFQ